MHHTTSPPYRTSSPHRFSTPPFSLRAYAQLLRLPNVFTALADICLGWLGALAAGMPVSRWPSFICLMGASAALYSAGMVWNDFFDLEQDRRERPFRPLPSGRIARRNAARLGVALLAAGIGFAALASPFQASAPWSALLLVVCLIAAILLYDAWLKRTWLGPVAMGTCRFLNILLGLSCAEATSLGWPARIYLASVVGLYIVGVTWFARTEARVSNQSQLRAAAGVMATALVLALATPLWSIGGTSSVLFPYLLVGLGFLVGIPAAQAIAEPTPGHVQRTVKRAIVGLVVLDAALATALCGMLGLMILVLLLPLLYLGQWIYST
ncbi:MAG TPA: UbiA family prenyltransferase [Gemmataceae bacterium]|nr:UbiA family prenyltransferase [Gemmataceae bacterium]